MNTLQKIISGAAAFSMMGMVVPSGQTVAVAPQALEHAPVIISLGEAVDPHTGKIVEGFKVIHYKKGNAKPEGAGGGKGKTGGGDTCYAFLANGAKWKAPEPFVVDTANTAGLDEFAVYDLMAAGVAEWEAQVTSDIFGAQSAGAVNGADESSPDGVNEVLFGNIDSPGAIAVTIVWGVFRGPSWQRQLSEWDMVFDQDDFGWSTVGEAGKMDFLNIAVHELGHALGLGHPGDSCAEETMYRYADYGETKKRDLHTGDIAGVVALY